MNRIGRISFGLFCSFCLVLVLARAETLTIATYNIENYGPADRVTEAGYRKDYPKPEPEKRALRAVIRALDADVLVLQEMGGQPYLDELRHDLKQAGLDYPYAALAVAADADRHVALLSRKHEYEADAFAREAVGGSGPMVGALRKLAQKNLSNLTPHPWFSAFFYSHPTLVEREAALGES